jgi:hypothetical protein
VDRHTLPIRGGETERRDREERQRGETERRDREERQRERDRQRDRKRYIETQIDRQTERQRGGQIANLKDRVDKPFFHDRTLKW